MFFLQICRRQEIEPGLDRVELQIHALEIPLDGGENVLAVVVTSLEAECARVCRWNFGGMLSQTLVKKLYRQPDCLDELLGFVNHRGMGNSLCGGMLSSNLFVRLRTV